MFQLSLASAVDNWEKYLLRVAGSNSVWDPESSLGYGGDRIQEGLWVSF